MLKLELELKALELELMAVELELDHFSKFDWSLELELEALELDLELNVSSNFLVCRRDKYEKAGLIGKTGCMGKPG